MVAGVVYLRLALQNFAAQKHMSGKSPLITILRLYIHGLIVLLFHENSQIKDCETRR